MTTLLQKLGTEGQMSPADKRNIILLTMLSKLVMARVMGLVATVVLLIN
jgi:hypothetical protein